SHFIDPVSVININNIKDLENDHQEGNDVAAVKQSVNIEVSDTMINCTAEQIKPSTFSFNKIPVLSHHIEDINRSSMHVLEKPSSVEIEVLETIHVQLERTKDNVKMQVTRDEFSEVNNDINETENSISTLTQDLNRLKLRLEEASDRSKWKLKTIDENLAVFTLKWGFWLYKCIVFIYIDCKNPCKLNINFEPCRKNPDEFTTLGYKFFQYLVNDKVLHFPLYSKKMIEKLTEYSNIAEKVEILMRDVFHVSVSDTYTLSENFNPLKFCVEILNENRMSKFLMTFYVNLHTYPLEKIVPEIKHLKFKDITKEVEIAVRNVEPGEDYIWNMVKLATDFK
ncbi:uncharacterized protein NPIL_606671, partial [Nephila pilipes]